MTERKPRPASGAFLVLLLTAWRACCSAGGYASPAAAGHRAEGAPARVRATVLEPFDTAENWKPASAAARGEGHAEVIGIANAPQPSAHGAPAHALVVQLSLPSAAGVQITPPKVWANTRLLRFSVYLPKTAPTTVSLGFYVKDNEWWWYQTFPLRRQASAGKGRPELIPGRWNPVEVDLRPEAEGWTPGGHQKPWSGSIRPFLELGILFYSKRPFHGTVEIGPVEKVEAPIRETGRTVAVQSSIEPALARQWQPVTLTLRLNRTYSNPFDPGVVALDAHFAGAMGGITVPGFVYQDYESVSGSAVPRPVGPELWKVRFTPTRPGRYTYRVTVRDGNGASTLMAGAFRCLEETGRGYVRIDESDHHYFGFDDGSWYYPIGLNVRHAGDDRHVHEGLPAIEHYFNKMASVGLNWTRTWMASWWLGIEWSHRYDARYHGVGRYNLTNAWLMDRTLDIAARDGLYVDLTLNNHGQFSASSDHEWEFNPYNVASGGKLQEPWQFFTDPWAKRMFKQRLRYIVARWGYSSHIFAWELFNEVDLVDGYKAHSQDVCNWMSEMSQYLRSIDPWQHLVSTHVCWWTADPLLWNNPDLQFVQADAYVRWTHGLDTMATFTDKVWRQKEQFDKPSYIVEFGYKLNTQTGDAHRDPVAQFHPGIWAGFMSPFSADSMFWDWYVVDEQNFWPQYAALVRFARGEDRRGQDLKVSLCSVDSDANLQANGINNHNRAYVWVYDPARQGSDHPARFTPVSGGRLLLNGLENGEYQVQFWNTFTGVVTGTTRVRSTGERMTVTLPPIAIDVALKIKRISNG